MNKILKRVLIITGVIIAVLVIAFVGMSLKLGGAVQSMLLYGHALNPLD